MTFLFFERRYLKIIMNIKMVKYLELSNENEKYVTDIIDKIKIKSREVQK